MTQVILLIVLVLGLMGTVSCNSASADTGLDGTVWHSPEKHGIALSITFVSRDTNNDNKVEAGEYACAIDSQRDLDKVAYSPRAYLDAANALSPAWHCIIKRGKFVKFQPSPEMAFVWGDPNAKAAFQGNALVISVKGKDFVFTQEGTSAAPSKVALAGFKRGPQYEGTAWEVQEAKDSGDWRIQFMLSGSDLNGDGSINEEYEVEVTPLYSPKELKQRLNAIRYPADDPWHSFELSAEEKAECERLKTGIETAELLTKVSMTLLLEGNTALLKLEHPRKSEPLIFRGTHEHQRLVLGEFGTLVLTDGR